MCNASLSLSWDAEQYALATIVALYATVGTVGNLLILAVYLKKHDRKTSSTFIRVLSLLDTCVCVFVMPYTIVYELHAVDVDVICRSFEVVRHFCILASNASLVAIAFERCVAVRRPTRRLTLSQVNKGMIVIVVISVMLAVPSVFIFAAVPGDLEVRGGNCTAAPFCHFTMSFLGEAATRAYQALLSLSYCLACLAIILLYSLIYATLWKKAKLRKKLSNPLGISPSRSYRCVPDGKGRGAADPCAALKLTASAEDIDTLTKKRPQWTYLQNPVSGKPVGRFSDKSMQHNRTAKMLFLCTIIYIVAWVPFWLDIFGITNSLILRYLFFVGNASNPIVYGIVNDRVREEISKLFRNRRLAAHP